MKTCGLLHHHINFEPDGIQPCCDVRDAGVPIFPFAGGELRLDDYARHIAAVSDALQKDAQYCAGCPELREDGKPFRAARVKPIRINAVSINHHRRLCDCRCVYCDLWRGGGKKAPYNVLPSLRRLAEQGALASGCVISWGGGEPSLLPEFPDTCRWAMEHGYSQYVHTNALRHSPAIETMLAGGTGLVNVSLDSGDAASYRAVKGVDGWDGVTATLERYAAACLAPEQIDVKYIIFDATNDLGQIENFFRLCLRLGLARTQYSLNFKEVNTRRVTRNTLIAAAFFIARAEQLGINAEGFYIDPPMAVKIEAYKTRLFAEERTA